MIDSNGYPVHPFTAKLCERIQSDSDPERSYRRSARMLMFMNDPGMRTPPRHTVETSLKQISDAAMMAKVPAEVITEVVTGTVAFLDLTAQR